MYFFRTVGLAFRQNSYFFQSYTFFIDTLSQGFKLRVCATKNLGVFAYLSLPPGFYVFI